MIRYPLLKSSKFINTESSKDYKDWKDRTTLHSTPLHNHTRRSMQPAQRFFIRPDAIRIRHLSAPRRCRLPPNPTKISRRSQRNTNTKHNTLKHTLTGITNTQPRAHASFPKLPRILALLSLSLSLTPYHHNCSPDAPRTENKRAWTQPLFFFLLLPPITYCEVFLS